MTIISLLITLTFSINFEENKRLIYLFPFFKLWEFGLGIMTFYWSEKLLENYNYFIESVKKEKPETIKGEFIKNIFLTSSMGISYKVGAK